MEEILANTFTLCTVKGTICRALSKKISRRRACNSRRGSCECRRRDAARGVRGHAPPGKKFKFHAQIEHSEGFFLTVTSPIHAWNFPVLVLYSEDFASFDHIQSLVQ